MMQLGTQSHNCGSNRLHSLSDASLSCRLMYPSGALVWRTAHQNTRCQAKADKSGKKKTGSYREKLKNIPAYKRQKEAWEGAYTPAKGTEKAPGPIPEHLLAGGGSQPTAARRIGSGGSITEQLQGAVAPPKASSSAVTAKDSCWSPSPSTPTDDASRRAQQSQETPAADKPAESSQDSAVVSTPTPAAPLQWSSDQRVSRVRFWIQFHAQFGQRMKVVGSHPRLGSWNLSQGAELQWSPGDKWNTIVEIPAGAILEYKYVLLEGDGIRSVAWQNGNNNVLAVGHSDDNVEVFDNWESSPGASVTTGGEKTTREGRLLAWATEIESLFSSQRNELRRSRMELAAAQDEARLAREEARQMRAELRASEAERMKAELKVRELTVGNRLLRTQLADNTLSFRNALETTHMYLLEAEKAMLAQKKGKSLPPGQSDPKLSSKAASSQGAATAGPEGSPRSKAADEAAAQTTTPATSKATKAARWRERSRERSRGRSRARGKQDPLSGDAPQQPTEGFTTSAAAGSPQASNGVQPAAEPQKGTPNSTEEASSSTDVLPTSGKRT